MKKRHFILSVILLTGALNLISAGYSFGQNNFSGTWKRNDEKTDGGGLSINSVALILEITQDDSSVIIKGTNRTGAGVVTNFTDAMKLDGSPMQRKAGTDQQKFTSIVWSADHRQLIQMSTYKDAEGNIKLTIKGTFTLSENGKELTISDQRSFDGETYYLTDVFDKQ